MLNMQFPDLIYDFPTIKVVAYKFPKIRQNIKSKKKDLNLSC